jgi:hypothetical protein
MTSCHLTLAGRLGPTLALLLPLCACGFLGWGDEGPAEPAATGRTAAAVADPVAGVATEMPAPAAPAARNQTDTLFQTYYQRPSAETAMRVIAGFDETFATSDWDTTTQRSMAALAGWLAVVFQRQPEQKRAIVESIRTGPGALAVAMALSMSGDAERSASILQQIQAPSEVERAVAELSDDLPAESVQLVDDIDRHWGAAFASGDPAYLRPIVDAMLRPIGANGISAARVAGAASGEPQRVQAATQGLSATARTRLLIAAEATRSLRLNNREHAFVTTALLEAACRYSDQERLQLLRALLAGARPATVPPCAREAFQTLSSLPVPEPARG